MTNVPLKLSSFSRFSSQYFYGMYDIGSNIFFPLSPISRVDYFFFIRNVTDTRVELHSFNIRTQEDVVSTFNIQGLPLFNIISPQVIDVDLDGVLDVCLILRNSSDTALTIFFGNDGYPIFRDPTTHYLNFTDSGNNLTSVFLYPKLSDPRTYIKNNSLTSYPPEAVPWLLNVGISETSSNMDFYNFSVAREKPGMSDCIITSANLGPPFEVSLYGYESDVQYCKNNENVVAAVWSTNFTYGLDVTRPDKDIAFSYSLDYGITWKRPVIVNISVSPNVSDNVNDYRPSCAFGNGFVVVSWTRLNSVFYSVAPFKASKLFAVPTSVLNFSIPSDIPQLPSALNQSMNILSVVSTPSFIWMLIKAQGGNDIILRYLSTADNSSWIVPSTLFDSSVSNVNVDRVRSVPTKISSQEAYLSAWVDSAGFVVGIYKSSVLQKIRLTINTSGQFDLTCNTLNVCVLALIENNTNAYAILSVDGGNSWSSIKRNITNFTAADERLYDIKISTLPNSSFIITTFQLPSTTTTFLLDKTNVAKLWKRTVHKNCKPESAFVVDNALYFIGKNAFSKYSVNYCVIDQTRPFPTEVNCRSLSIQNRTISVINFNNSICTDSGVLITTNVTNITKSDVTITTAWIWGSNETIQNLTVDSSSITLSNTYDSNISASVVVVYGNVLVQNSSITLTTSNLSATSLQINGDLVVYLNSTVNLTYNPQSSETANYSPIISVSGCVQKDGNINIDLGATRSSVNEIPIIESTCYSAADTSEISVTSSSCRNAIPTKSKQVGLSSIIYIPSFDCQSVATTTSISTTTTSISTPTTGQPQGTGISARFSLVLLIILYFLNFVIH
eukprot:TRINITY_DN1499_c0_g1_i4.p1 TRINITY_DN1499_c0_g1~~TRINITY_DN1499_c0_g1_i4.p1  ORF type:complete len:842 (-),score=62.66 TRINITY_DN1499_c0_g1_i4:17-2542(-)